MVERVQKLHLVGVTTDQEGLILSTRNGARTGGYTLAIDDALVGVIETHVARQAAEAEAREAERAAAASRRPDSRLGVREVQAQLRRGRSIDEVARAAGVDPTWVERFAPPVRAEQAQVIDRVRALPLQRARLGASALPIGDAVSRNLAERGVVMTPGEIDAAWEASQVADDRWSIRFAYHYRGRDRTLRFELDEASGEVLAADRASGQLGYVAPAPSARGSRVDKASNQPSSRPGRERQRATSAMTEAAAKRAQEAERAAARKAREREAVQQRIERERRAEERAAAARAAVAAREAEAAKAAKARATEKAKAAKAAARAKAAKAKTAEKAKAAKAAKTTAAKPNRKATVATAKPNRKAAVTTAKPNRKATVTTAKPNRKATVTKAKSAASSATARTASAAATPTVAPASRTATAATSTAPVRTPMAPATKASKPQGAATDAPVSGPAPQPTGAPAPPMAGTAAPPPLPERAVTRDEDRAPVAPPATLSGAAIDVYGSASARALFRAGLAEQVTAAGEVGDGSSGNGLRPAAGPAGRPRRTRPLRAQ